MKAICVDDERLLMEDKLAMCREIDGVDEAHGFTMAEAALEFARKDLVDIALLDIDIIDLAGHTVDLKRDSSGSSKHVFEAKNGAALIIIDSVGSGCVKGGWENDGGYVNNDSTVKLYGINVRENKSGKELPADCSTTPGGLIGEPLRNVRSGLAAHAMMVF